MRMRILRKVVLTVLVILGLLVPAAAAGQGVCFSSWKEIGGGETQHYVFRYHYDNRQTGDEEDIAPVPVTVILTAGDASRSFGFTVNTAETLRRPMWQDTDDDGQEEFSGGALGVGSPLVSGEHHDTVLGLSQEAYEHEEIDNEGTYGSYNILVWSGATPENVAFFLDVTNSSNQIGHYKLSITGPISDFTCLP